MRCYGSSRTCVNLVDSGRSQLQGNGSVPMHVPGLIESTLAAMGLLGRKGSENTTPVNYVHAYLKR